MSTYLVRLSNGDTCEADTVPEIIEGALTIAREADCFHVQEAHLAGAPSKPLTAVVRWAVLEARPDGLSMGLVYDYSRDTGLLL